MTSRPEDRPAAADQGARRDPTRSWWGLGDVAAGIVAAQVLSILVLGIVYGAAGWTSSSEVPLWATGLLQIPLWCGLAGAVVHAGRTKGSGLGAEFGFSARALDAPLGLVVGVASQLVLLPIIYWPLLSLLGRSSEELSEPAEELASRADGTLGWLLLATMVVVAAPLVEELFYRGLLMGALAKRGWALWPSVLGSSAVFGAMHFQPLQFVGLFAFGVVLALLASWQGRLGAAMWAHAGFNATTVVSLYMQA